MFSYWFVNQNLLALAVNNALDNREYINYTYYFVSLNFN